MARRCTRTRADRECFPARHGLKLSSLCPILWEVTRVSEAEQLSTDEEPRLVALVSKCCLALFEIYGVELTAIGADQNVKLGKFDICGVVPFTGERLLGTVMLAATEKLLTRCHPQSVFSREWVGELTNQLIGRLKNTLSAQGAGTIYFGTPGVVRGAFIAGPEDDMGGAPIPLRFEADGEPVCVWLDGMMERELFREVDASTEDDESLDEGEMMMF